MLHLKWVILFSLGLLLSLFCEAQQTISELRKGAPWIKMMDAPNVNYYDAIKVYDDYWKTHKKPDDPEDRLSQPVGTKEKETDKVQLTKEEKKFEDEMIYQIKRFENWVREEKPFVQEDGRILTQQERIAIWKKQQEERTK